MLALVLAVASLAPFEPAEKRATTLGQRVDASSFICIGTVDEVIPVPRPDGVDSGRFVDEKTPLEFARIRVERVIKGDAATKIVYHEAWPTWMCDSTSANPGERSLFLLEAGVVSKLTAKQRGLVESSLSSKLILRAVFSGDGIIPIHGEGDRAFVHCFPSVKDMVLPDEPYSSKWKPVLGYVETLARFAPDAVSLLARSLGSFDLRVLPDGQRRFALLDGIDNEVITVDQFEPVRWKQLRSALEAIVGDSDWAVGPERFWNLRHLRIRTERNTLDFIQTGDMNLDAVHSSERLGLVRSLEAWKLVRDALDCDSCVDDRESDRKVLQGLKK